MQRKIVVCAILGVMGLACLMGLYVFGKAVKTRWIVHKTLIDSYRRARCWQIVQARAKCNKIVFLGNSLTDNFELWDHFHDPDMLNCGIDGDFTEGLLQRLDDVIALQPEKIFIEIGINDLVEQVPAPEIISNYEELIDRIHEKLPGTKIYVQSNLPIWLPDPGFWTSNEELNRKIVAQNLRLQDMALRKDVVFIDLYTAFKRSGKTSDLLVADGVHLTPKAYAVWKFTVLPYVQADMLKNASAASQP